MMQKTQQERVRGNEMYEAISGIGRILVAILKGCFYVIRKISIYAVNGFHGFVENAEHQGLPHNEYWWDSPDLVEKMIKR